jgi:hypothetical protein
MITKNCNQCGKLFPSGNPGIYIGLELSSFISIDFDDKICTDCLIDIQTQKINEFIASTPREKLIKIAGEYKSDNILEKLDYTIEEGKWVFTSWFLLKRGFCCGSGCRNCPY